MALREQQLGFQDAMQPPEGVTILPELLNGVEDVVREEQHVTLEEIKKQLPAHGLNLNFAMPEAEQNVKRALYASDQIEVVGQQGGEALYRWVDNKKSAGKRGLEDEDNHTEKVVGEIFVTIEGKEDAPKTDQGRGQKEDDEKIIEEKKDSEGPLGTEGEVVWKERIPSSSLPRVSSITGKKRLGQLPMQARNMKRFLTDNGGNGDGGHETHRAMKKPKQGEGATGLVLEGLRGMPMELHLRCENFDGRKGNVTGSIEIVGDSENGDEYPTWD
jgi:hypothetical protein